jgi:hypothetical protein
MFAEIVVSRSALFAAVVVFLVVGAIWYFASKD